ncbi:hypothetical protein K3718_09900 [Leisingera aquaemixtae]|uniref:Phage protein n=1 Tax=Leisingera aquaemixtae TaxID=1396826 RepID=A0ABY5WEL5_9RHOB|nr:hypothetical protein [Leisingera aquaemixtae]UWQ39903.1 hypothetical protein K3718_09900 [Leisingera aquaemixtae]
MQYDTKFDPETPLERAALRAVKTARWFAQEWRETSIEADGLRLRQLAPTLDRLEDGILYDNRDETILELIEKAIVQYLDDHLEGYGTRALYRNTSGDELRTTELQRCRDLIEQWKVFKHARQHVIDMRRARIIADQFS